jgi:hypothetical protein
MRNKLVKTTLGAWGHSLVVECVFSMFEVLGLIPSLKTGKTVLGFVQMATV